MEERAPLNDAIGVRAAETITTSDDAVARAVLENRRAVERRSIFFTAVLCFNIFVETNSEIKKSYIIIRISNWTRKK
jgi:hypothetical protein